mmetsp:Transcript_30170/g.48684  ORF Transcript_30170/g.48684 Transcript_30170/m.48684 type:complete len:250 (+) Transcript_30170:60-809(+)
MSDTWLCKPCTASDPRQDTVKVDPSALALLESSCMDKENLQPQRNMELNVEEAEMARKREVEKLRLQREEKLREERETEERRKRAEEDAKRMAEALAAAKAAEDEARKQEAEEKARREAEAFAKAEEEERIFREAQEAARVESERQQEENRQAAIKVNAWCQNNGYKDMNSAKKTFKGETKFPLHTAVKHWRVEMVELMVQLDVNKDAKDSKGRTPLDIVQKLSDCEARDRMFVALAPGSPIQKIGNCS